MKANELRIGNTIFNETIPVTVDGRTIFDMAFNDEIANKYSPIPLTEEWLLKMGATKKHYWWTFPTMLWLKLYGASRNENGFISFHVEYRRAFYSEFEYVHQLQNFYFTIKGEELTIKE